MGGLKIAKKGLKMIGQIDGCGGIIIKKQKAQ